MANETLRETTNRANPNSLNDVFRTIKLGDIITRKVRRVMRAQAPVASAVTLAGPLVCGRILLPEQCKASRITRAWARAGGGTLGEMTVHALNANPGANEIAVSPCGDIVTRQADAYTSVDVEYEPVSGKLIELLDVPVVAATGVCTLPPAIAALGPHMLVSAVSTVGTLVATMTPTWRAAAAPATTFACLNLIGTIVYFAVADGVTRCNLKLYVAAEVDEQALLVADTLSP